MMPDSYRVKGRQSWMPIFLVFHLWRLFLYASYYLTNSRSSQSALFCKKAVQYAEPELKAIFKELLTKYMNKNVLENEADRIRDLIKDEVNVMEINRKKGKELTVSLDTTLTPELELQTKTRELIRSIQNQRKELGVNISDHVDVVSSWLPDDPNLLAYLKKKTLSQNVLLGDKLEVTKV